ncbi:hypothetical protein VC83_02794 [Pseudogymnoascus destructans]|uniref:Uncharacterized protein n=1 Tax=Pseudogymnoascus destructans TaxID=655981 RepID=A0A177AEU7_9PEZI|nr:uncharacterized protein VC83_02794 [Pseudogymnoascus destructans]OAF59932.1 hypothetical protein VC83_02794 [Pseudogymnoascus destructans]
MMELKANIAKFSVEMACSPKGWYTGAFSIPSASFKISLRVYHAAADNTLVERAYDGGGTLTAVIVWATEGKQLRVYFQNGTQVSGVSEWVWSGGWVKGAAVIPPAAQ